MTRHEKQLLLNRLDSAISQLEDMETTLSYLVSLVHEANNAIKAEEPIELPVKGSIAYNDRA